MIRITNQYIWNVIFTLFFLALVVLGAIILDTEAQLVYEELAVFDVALLALATMRLTRLFVYDTTTKWLREQFWDVKKVGRDLVLERPQSGPRRTLADMFGCPWCFGMWAAALLTFFYLLTPWTYYIVLFLAVAAVAGFFQLLANLVGYKAEQLKQCGERL